MKYDMEKWLMIAVKCMSKQYYLVIPYIVRGEYY